MLTIDLVKDIFKNVEIVQVREKQSYEYAEKFFGEAKIVMKPDALFTWYNLINDGFAINNGKYFIGPSGADNSSFYAYDFTKPYICIAGSSSIDVLAANENEAVEKYSDLVKAVKRKFQEMNVYLVEVCEGDNFLRRVSVCTGSRLIPIDTPIVAAAKILANSKVFISGRYHPAIMASLGGTPCVFMSSNSHKTRSLQELLGYEEAYEFSVLPNYNEIQEIVEIAERNIQSGEELRNKIESV